MTNSPFHDPQDNPLPDANDIEQDATRGVELYSLPKTVDTHGPSPHIKQDIQRLRNAIILLVAIGAALGCVMGIGVAIVLKRTGLMDSPKSSQERTYDLPVSSNSSGHISLQSRLFR